MIIGLGTYSEKSLLPSLDKIGHPSHPLLKIGTTVHLGLIRSSSMLAHSLFALSPSSNVGQYSH